MFHHVPRKAESQISFRGLPAAPAGMTILYILNMRKYIVFYRVSLLLLTAPCSLLLLPRNLLPFRGQSMSNVRSAQTDKVRFFGNTTPQELAAQYGTPLYVYNEDVLRRRCRELLGLSSLPGFHVNYSAKANTNLALLRIVREEGCHADAMSPGELHINKLAGFTPDRPPVRLQQRFRRRNEERRGQRPHRQRGFPVAARPVRQGQPRRQGDDPHQPRHRGRASQKGHHSRKGNQVRHRSYLTG